MKKIIKAVCAGLTIGSGAALLWMAYGYSPVRWQVGAFAAAGFFAGLVGLYAGEFTEWLLWHLFAKQFFQDVSRHQNEAEITNAVSPRRHGSK